MKPTFWLCIIKVNLAHAINHTEGKMTTAQSNETRHYLIATGSEDYERLLILNEVVNPYSLPFLKRYIKLGAKVLEIGCGIGLMSQEIAKLVGDKGTVLGTDLYEDQFANAQKLSSGICIKGLRYQKASAYDLSGIGKDYDVVYMRFLFIHLEDVTKALDQIKTVLKPGGLILIEELVGNDTIANDPKDIRLAYVRKMDDLQEEIQKSNFAIATSLGETLETNGFKVVSDKVVHPQLDTPNNRRLFSLGMKSLEESLIKNEIITREESQTMIKEVEDMEADASIKLYFYKIGQIAARLK